MTLILTIENEQSLPNGAPVSVRLTEKRGIDIGRSATIDWSLPDPTRFISGRHCEVRYRDDGYWLNDLSTNGTFLNDSARRIHAPHKLRHGDRLAIGSYVIAVAIEEDENGEAAVIAPDGETARSGGAGIAALAPIEGGGPTSLDVEIAQAIASETAPEPAPPPDLPRAAPDAAASGIPGASLPDAGGAGRREGAPAPRPNTMVRARGFGVDPAPRPPAESAVPEARQERGAAVWGEEPDTVDAPTLNPNEEEARAWSAPSGAPAFNDPRPGSGAEGPGPRGSGDAIGAEEFLRRFAKGAGIPDHILARQDPLKVAEDLGALMRLTVEDLTQLLSARFKAKRFARTSSQTMIQALDNNPLKFAPTPSDALKIMFGPRTSGYLDARRAFEGAFTDLKSHQVATFAAMQQAVRMLVEDLDPQAIEDAAGEDKGLAAFFGAHKARLWDLYLARWQAKTLRHEDGLVDAFMLYFAQCYDQGKESK
jgi:type VI secretion system protein ImpI